MALPWAIQQIKNLLAKFPVKISDGGTGMAANPSMLADLSSTSAADVFQASPRPGVTGVLGPGSGGTGMATNPVMLTNLSSTSAAGVFQASPRPGVTGILGVQNGGTGVNSLAKLKTALGIDTSNAAPKPISGTGVGQWWEPVFGGPGGAPTLKLPAGGTWVYFIAYQYGATPTFLSGMAQGGTTLASVQISGSDGGSVIPSGFAWRIA